MALNKNEKNLVSGIKAMLLEDTNLGLTTPPDANSKTERSLAYLHEQIDDMFQVKAAEFLHAESVCRAFRKVHSYKYLDDPTFTLAMEREMLSEAVPAVERTKALDSVHNIIAELTEEQNAWAERDAGFNPALDEIRKISKPKQPDNFSIHDSKLNKKNVESTAGDASPARTGLGAPPTS